MKFTTITTKVLCGLLCCFLSLQITAQTTVLSTEKWQEDVRFFQTTVHDNFPFLFKKVKAEVFDTAIEKLYNDIPSMEDHEVMAGLLRAVSLFEYGHTDMAFDGVLSLHALPINLYQYNDGTYIEGGHKMYQNIIGGKVIAIEGMPIDEGLELIEPTVPAENEQYFRAFGINYLGITELLHAQGITKKLQQEITFTVEKGGKTFKQTVKAMPRKEVARTSYNMVKQEGEWVSARSQDATPYYLKDLEKNYYFEYLPEQKTVYVRHSKVRNDDSETIKAFFGRVFDFVDQNEVEKFVLDVRLNGGGNNYLNKPIITGIIENKKINKKGRLFTIIGRRTFSAAQNMINELDQYTNVTFVGEPSAENLNFYGDAKQIKLPNSKYTMYLSWAWWQDKSQWENAKWMAPDMPVDMSFAEYSNNQDPVLEAALNVVAKDDMVDPMEYLTELFTAGKYEEVKRESRRIATSPDYKDYDFKGNFTVAGKRLLGIEQAQAAVFIFDMLTELFPEAADVHLEMANTYAKIGQVDKAKIYYNKTISLDKNGTFGKAAKSGLEDLSKK